MSEKTKYLVVDPNDIFLSQKGRLYSHGDRDGIILNLPDWNGIERMPAPW